MLGWGVGFLGKSKHSPHRTKDLAGPGTSLLLLGRRCPGLGWPRVGEGSFSTQTWLVILGKGDSRDHQEEGEGLTVLDPQQAARSGKKRHIWCPWKVVLLSSLFMPGILWAANGSPGEGPRKPLSLNELAPSLPCPPGSRPGVPGRMGGLQAGSWSNSCLCSFIFSGQCGPSHQHLCLDPAEVASSAITPKAH